MGGVNWLHSRQPFTSSVIESVFSTSLTQWFSLSGHECQPFLAKKKFHCKVPLSKGSKEILFRASDKASIVKYESDP